MAYGRWHFLMGEGTTEPMWDCTNRHHATMDPQEWDHLRSLAFLADLTTALDDLQGN